MGLRGRKDAFLIVASDARVTWKTGQLASVNVYHGQLCNGISRGIDLMKWDLFFIEEMSREKWCERLVADGVRRKWTSAS